MEKKVIIFVSLFLSIFSCSKNIPFDVKKNLEKAGENRTELDSAIDYFIQKDDSLQLEALYFLLRNMDEHSFVEFGLYDSNDVELEYNVLNHPDYKSLITMLDSIEAKDGELHFDRKEKISDLEQMTSELLIENIELAFNIWREKDQSLNIPFETFLELILPYRGSSEPLESFRKYFIKRYQYLSDEIPDNTDIIEIAKAINMDLMEWFKFDERYYLHPTDQGLSEMIETGMGRCEDMTNLAIYAMRANGLPVTSDYTPHWADTGNNHAWNAILTKDKQAIPFMGCEAHPGDYSLRPRVAKVYRKTFAAQKDNLSFLLKEWEKAPGWLSGKYYSDVTNQYTAVADIEIAFETIPDSTRFAYLCVFNSGEWRAINWGEIRDSSVVFTDMGVDLAYLPMFYVHEELIPGGSALILDKNGVVRKLDGADESTKTLKLISTSKAVIKDATENKELVFLDQDESYELFHWDDEWCTLGEKLTGTEPLIYEEVPGNRLYWLVKEGSKKKERIFTYENGEQVWW